MTDEIDDRIRAVFRERADEVIAAAADTLPVAPNAASRWRTPRFLSAAALLLVAVIGAGIWQASRNDGKLIRTTDQPPAAANQGPRQNVDHWQASFAVEKCGSFIPYDDETQNVDTIGITGTDDEIGGIAGIGGIVHIAPRVPGASGLHATLALFLRSISFSYSPAFAGNITNAMHSQLEASDGCDGKPAHIVIAVWSKEAESRRDPPTIVATPDDAVFRENGMAMVIAMVPNDFSPADITLPPSAADVDDANPPPTTTSVPEPAGDNILIDATGVAGARLGDLVTPSDHPTYGDKAQTQIVRQCTWTTDTTLVPGVTVTLENTSVGGIIVAVQPDHPVTTDDVHLGETLAQVVAAYPSGGTLTGPGLLPADQQYSTTGNGPQLLFRFSPGGASLQSITAVDSGNEPPSLGVGSSCP